MDTGQRTQPPVMTHQQWSEIVSQFALPEEGPNLHRSEVRCFATCVATLRIEDPDGQSPGSLVDMIQISENGCMLRTHVEMQRETPVAIECCFDEEVFILKGQVAHSTGTVGGFKTGIQLCFPEDEA